VAVYDSSSSIKIDSHGTTSHTQKYTTPRKKIKLFVGVNKLANFLLFFSVFIEEKLGVKYVQRHSVNFEESFEEAGPATPIFFILSPGVNPLKDVENLGIKLGYSTRRRNFHSVSLGQGQETVAEKAMAVAATEGHWVILQVGLTPEKYLRMRDRK
jgi:hypothetical protein